MDNLLTAALKSQTVPSGILCIICWLGWPAIIAILREFQGKDRLQFNCDPKPNEYTTQQCYRNYNSDFSPRLTPLNFAGITFGVSGFGLLTVTLLNVWLLQRIRDEENNTIREKKKGHFYWTFICHICCQLAFLVVMMGLFCHHQKREYPAEYRCFSENTTFTCNDSRYKDKSTVNIAIIVVFVLSIVFCLVAIIHLILNRKKILKHLLGNVEEDTREENRSLDPSNNEPGTRADNDGPAVQYHAQAVIWERTNFVCLKKAQSTSQGSSNVLWTLMCLCILQVNYLFAQLSST